MISAPLREVGFYQGEDGSVILTNVPYGKTVIEIHLKALSNANRKLIRQMTERGDPDRDEKMQALLITKFGEQSGVTSQELVNNEDYTEGFVIVDDAIIEHILKKRYVFVPIKPTGMAENDIRPEQQDLQQLSPVG